MASRFYLYVLCVFISCSSFVIADGEERPAFNITSKIGSNIEIRQYLPSKWACTTSSYSWLQDSNMFWSLFYYIQGKNDQNLKMPMTAPVLSWYNTTQTKYMCFFIGKQYQTNTPNPNSTDVFIVSYPATTLATISFGGYASNSDYAKKQQELINSLGTDASKNYDSLLIMAGYDAPFKLFGRSNEVWMKKTSN